MAYPTLEVRVDWRDVGFSSVTNDGFETDTSGWVVTAGINAAGTSITRTAGGYAGSYCGRLVTTATSGSGCNFDFGTTSFTSGRTYRLRAYIKSVSGTTSARLRLGSLGTGADRGDSSPTITGSWAVYTVDWTPSGTRTDAEAAITNGAASAMTADIDHVEVFEVIGDISALVTEASWTRGTSTVGGGASIGSALLVVRNDDNRFDPANTGGTYGSNVKLGREVWVRSTWAGAPYAHFYGSLERIALRPKERLAELHCVDAFDILEGGETSVAASITRSVRTFRGLVLDDAGIASAQRDMDSSDPENMIPLTEADQASPLAVLEALNEATGTAHYMRPSVSASVLAQYVSVARTDLATGSPVQALSGDDVDVGDVTYDLARVVNVMKATPVQRTMGANATLWESDRVPFTVNASATRTLWASWDSPAFGLALDYTATNSPTVTLTAFSRSAKIVITAGGSATTVSALSVTGEPYEAADQETAEVRDAPSVVTYWTRIRRSIGRNIWVSGWRKATRLEPSTIRVYGRREGEIVSDYLPNTARAAGLASWWVYRYAEPTINPAVVVRADDPTTQVARELTERVSLTSTRLSLTATELLITGLSTRVGPAGDWTTTYLTETAPTVAVWFTLGGSADQGIGGSGILAY